jgi:hypothetical protein
MPQLKELAWSIFVKGKITEKVISSLAEQFPLKVDSSLEVDDKTAAHMLPGGLLYNATAEPVGVVDISSAAPEHMRKWENLYSLLKTGWKEHETWRFFAWSHYQDALFFARTGDLDSARQSIDFSRAIGSSTNLVNRLEDAVKTSKGKIDISPFILSADTDK